MTLRVTSRMSRFIHNTPTFIPLYSYNRALGIIFDSICPALDVRRAVVACQYTDCGTGLKLKGSGEGWAGALFPRRINRSF